MSDRYKVKEEFSNEIDKLPFVKGFEVTVENIQDFVKSVWYITTTPSDFMNARTRIEKLKKDIEKMKKDMEMKKDMKIKECMTKMKEDIEGIKEEIKKSVVTKKKGLPTAEECYKSDEETLADIEKDITYCEKIIRRNYLDRGVCSSIYRHKKARKFIKFITSPQCTVAVPFCDIDGGIDCKMKRDVIAKGLESLEEVARATEADILSYTRDDVDSGAYNNNCSVINQDTKDLSQINNTIDTFVNYITANILCCICNDPHAIEISKGVAESKLLYDRGAKFPQLVEEITKSKLFQSLLKDGIIIDTWEEREKCNAVPNNNVEVQIFQPQGQGEGNEVPNNNVEVQISQPQGQGEGNEVSTLVSYSNAEESPSQPQGQGECNEVSGSSSYLDAEESPSQPQGQGECNEVSWSSSYLDAEESFYQSREQIKNNEVCSISSGAKGSLPKVQEQTKNRKVSSSISSDEKGSISQPHNTTPPSQKPWFRRFFNL